MKLIYKKASILLCLSLFLISCSDAMLDKSSPNNPSTEEVWEDPQTALTSMLTACYDALQNKELYNGDPFTFGPINMDCITDNGGYFNWSGWKQGFTIVMGRQTPSDALFSAYWRASYNVIIKCNEFIVSAEKVTDIDPALKAQKLAEAKTIRALIYNNLISLYQDVPLILTPTKLEDCNVPKTDKAQILKTILADLHESVKVLPKEAELGRITKGAALAILGRTAMYNGMWSEAIKAYKEITTLGYGLYPDYGKLFTKEGEASNEIIFSVRYEGPGLGEGSSIGKHWRTPLEAVNATLDLADAFYIQATGKKTEDKNYGKLNSDGGLDINRPNIKRYEGRDPRLYTTLFVPGMKWNGKLGNPNSDGSINYAGGATASMSTIYVKKYFDDADTKNSSDSGQDFYVIRYPEVLLSLAEAQVQSGAYNYNEVVALVDQVRERAGMPTVEKVEGAMGMLNKDDLLEVIKHERRVELAFEGLRLFDLYRWRDWEKSIVAIEKERTTLKLGYYPRRATGPRDYVWPIPTSELDTNTELKQHDLWK